jgi:hypothetical protein
MAKKYKSVFNQNFEKEQMVEDKMVEIVSKQSETNDFDESIKNNEISELTNNDAPQYPLEVKEVEPVVVKEVEPVVVKPKRTIDSLSKAEYRMYLRTGKIPE